MLDDIVEEVMLYREHSEAVASENTAAAILLKEPVDQGTLGHMASYLSVEGS
jgi:hypothetical protein